MIAADWFLLGAPWDCSGSGRGEQAAPDAFRTAGLSALVGRDLGDAATVIDSVERDEHTGVLALRETVRAAHALAGALAGALRDLPGRRPLVVGGDCSILLGIFPALRRQVGTAGLWFVDGHPDHLDGHPDHLDGHPDHLDGASSDTGETADMDLAALTGDGATALVELAGAPPMIPASDAVLLGHRTGDLDEGAAAELARLPTELRRIDAATVAADPAASGQRAAAWLASTGRGVWLHLDLDVLNPESLTAVTYPQPGDSTGINSPPRSSRWHGHRGCSGSASRTSGLTWTPPVSSRCASWMSSRARSREHPGPAHVAPSSCSIRVFYKALAENDCFLAEVAG